LPKISSAALASVSAATRLFFATNKSIATSNCSIENGILESGEVASRLQVQRSEQARLKRELESADALVMSVDLHPTAIQRFRPNLEQISAAGGAG
jgi:hypothetical protein